MAGADDTIRTVIGRANRRYLERYRDAAKLMGVIEQVSRYDEHVSAARISTMQHFADRAERSIRRLQRAESIGCDPRVDALVGHAGALQTTDRSRCSRRDGRPVR